MAIDDPTPVRVVSPLEAHTVAPWVGILALTSLASWITLPLAAWAFGAVSWWWIPLGVGALVHYAVRPLVRAWAARNLRPKVVAFLAARALASGAFATAPAALISLARPLERGLLDAAAEFVGTTAATMAFGVLAAHRFPTFHVPTMIVSCLLAGGLRVASRPWLAASSKPFLDASRAEARHLGSAALGSWEITDVARQHFLDTVRTVAERSAHAEHLHHARSRSIGAAQLAFLLAPFAWVCWNRTRTGLPLPFHDLVFVSLVPAPALGALRALDTLTLLLFTFKHLGAPSPQRNTLALPEAPIELRAVTVRYGHHIALDRVSLTLPPYGITVVLGPNGAGKSTLARVIAGALQPTEGRCTANGVALTEVSPAQVAFVPQHPCFVEEGSVLHNVHLIAPTANPTEVAETLAALGLQVALDRSVSELSRGEQRRVAVARALLKRPRLLVLDEPDAWLDRRGREALAAVLRREGESRAVVWVTHRADLVDPAARVVVLSAAHTVETEGTAHAVQASSPTVRTLLEALSDESFRFTETPQVPLRPRVEEGQQLVSHGRRVGATEIDELARERTVE